MRQHRNITDQSETFAKREKKKLLNKQFSSIFTTDNKNIVDSSPRKHSEMTDFTITVEGVEEIINEF